MSGAEHGTPIWVFNHHREPDRRAAMTGQPEILGWAFESVAVVAVHAAGSSRR